MSEKPDLKERIALANSSDLAISAFAVQSRLGYALWGAKYRHDRAALKLAQVLVCSELASDVGAFAAINKRAMRTGRKQAPQAMSESFAGRLVAQALAEWVIDKCTQCHGRGTVGERAALRPCPKCKGSGRAKHTQQMRSAALGVSAEVFDRQWKNVLDQLVTQFYTIDAAVERGVKFQMSPGRTRTEMLDSYGHVKAGKALMSAASVNAATLALNVAFGHQAIAI
ncbi:MAG: hypothetical protein ACRCV9_16215 [Burkholderiaceae bacterium]